MIYATFGILTVIILYLLWAMVLQNKDHRKHVERIIVEHHANYEQWSHERQQLLDRIQASSFAEYKTQEIRVIKAQTGEKEPPKLEIM